MILLSKGKKNVSITHKKKKIKINLKIDFRIFLCNVQEENDGKWNSQTKRNDI